MKPKYISDYRCTDDADGEIVEVVTRVIYKIRGMDGTDEFVYEEEVNEPKV
jgi:hypothetical protein